jgi:probable phosphoglycerate mutase
VVTSSEQAWPTRLILVRHGESAGNVARDAAEAAGMALIEIAQRDVDVPLSSLGERQSLALGRWYAEQPESQQPSVILTSPYVRAMQSAALIVESARLAKSRIAQVVDERLREKEFGILNRLTKAGIQTKYPDQWDLRLHIGKFYYRPPGGESWCDVILRLRSFLNYIQLQYRRERVMIVAHQVVVLCFRYLLEGLTEAELLSIDREKDVANCSITAYEFARDQNDRQYMALRAYNFVAPLQAAGEPVTNQPDAPTAAR